MIGPLLIIAFLARAWMGEGKPVPCERQTCTAEAYYADTKEDPTPVTVSMGPHTDGTTRQAVVIPADMTGAPK